jgi:hypothetical protein
VPAKSLIGELIGAAPTPDANGVRTAELANFRARARPRRRQAQDSGRGACLVNHAKRGGPMRPAPVWCPAGRCSGQSPAFRTRPMMARPLLVCLVL